MCIDKGHGDIESVILKRRTCTVFLFSERYTTQTILKFPTHMSTAVDARRRPSLWSYISFSSPPRRRSVSLPTRNNVDVHEKDDRRRNVKLEYTDEGRMTQSQRSRYLKTGGVLAFIFFLLYLLAPNHGTNIGDVVKGMSLMWASYIRR